MGAEYRQIYPTRVWRVSDSDPAIDIRQDGTGNLFTFNDGGTDAFRLTDGGPLSSLRLFQWDVGVAITAAAYQFGRDTDGVNQLHWNVPTGATFEWSINDVAEITLSASTLDILSNTVTNAVVGSGWNLNSASIIGNATLSGTITYSAAAAIIFSNASPVLDANAATANITIIARRTAANAGIGLTVQSFNALDALTTRLTLQSGQATSELAFSAVDVVPSVDNTLNLGTAARRWSLVRGVTITSGDFVFENGWKLTEAERLGFREGIALVRPNNSVAQVFN